MEKERCAKEIRSYQIDDEDLPADAEPEEETERVYEITLTDAELYETFSAYWRANREREMYYQWFIRCVDDIGHRVHGYGGDDDYDELAVQAVERGKYGLGTLAHEYAQNYLKYKYAAHTLWWYAIRAFGFEDRYWEWLKDKGLGKPNANGVIMHIYPYDEWLRDPELI